MAGGWAPYRKPKPANPPRPCQPGEHEYTRLVEISFKPTGGRATPARAQTSGGNTELAGYVHVDDKNKIPNISDNKNHTFELGTTGNVSYGH